MAFWGVEVKPDKPYTHPSSKTSGRLRLSQATLGFGASNKKSLVQCNVGNKSPVLLCCLLPDKSEYCHLELEFDEEDKVVFSVIGPRSVHLTGYYLSSNHTHPGFDDSSESYGEDIGHSDTEKSNDCSDEDDYEDSFINDGDVEVSPPSPGFTSEEMEEDLMDDEKSSRKKDRPRRRRLRKYQISESDDDGSMSRKGVSNVDVAVKLMEREYEDKIPISSFIRCGETSEKQKLANDEVDDHTGNHSDGKADKSNGNNGVVDADPKTAVVDADPKNAVADADPKNAVVDADQKNAVVDADPKNAVVDADPKREPDIEHTSMPAANLEDLQQNEELKVGKKKSKIRERKGNYLHPDSIGDNNLCKDKIEVDDTNEKCKEPANDKEPDIEHTSMPAATLEDLQQNEEELKVEKKKSKKRERKGNTLHPDSIGDNNLCKDKIEVDDTNEKCKEPANDKEPDIEHTSMPAATLEDLQQNEEELKVEKKKSKKRERKGNTLHPDSIGDNNLCKDKIEVDDTNEKCKEPANDKEPDIEHTSMPAATLEDLQQNEEELKAGKKKSKKRERKGNALHPDSIGDNNLCKDKIEVDDTNEKCQEPANDKKSDAYAPQSDERKSKRKKRKVKGNEDVASMEKQAIPTIDDIMTMDIKESRSSHIMTFSNGLVVEELEFGKPNGEVASLGRKVKIHYTGMLKEGSNVYESSIGSNPSKFRLGQGKIIEGVQLGLEGMRVGGRRRLTIPPELGYGSKGNANSVPPNSWLRVEVELLNVS